MRPPYTVVHSMDIFVKTYPGIEIFIQPLLLFKYVCLTFLVAIRSVKICKISQLGLSMYCARVNYASYIKSADCFHSQSAQ